MIKRLFFILLLLLAFSAQAMEKATFEKLMSEVKKNNFTDAEKYLDEYEQASARDPEYFVLLLNYVVAKGESSQLVISSGEPAEGDLALKSMETGKVEGFLGERVQQDKKFIIDGIRKTQANLKYFPDRLDIHFGIVAIAERIKEKQIIGEQIVRMLKTSRKINNQWQWGPIGSMEGDPQEFMIQNILPRTSRLFREENKIADEQFIKISKALIKYYPETVYGYANLGAMSMANKQYDKAEKYYKQALKLDKNDKVVLGNLEYLKQLKKEKKY